MKKVFGQKKVRIIFELSYMDVYYLLCTDFTEKKKTSHKTKSPNRHLETLRYGFRPYGMFLFACNDKNPVSNAQVHSFPSPPELSKMPPVFQASSGPGGHWKGQDGSGTKKSWHLKKKNATNNKHQQTNVWLRCEKGWNGRILIFGT